MLAEVPDRYENVSPLGLPGTLRLHIGIVHTTPRTERYPRPGGRAMTKDPSTRLAWADGVRGFCVLAVVLSHFILWGLEPVVGSAAQVFWEKASGQLTPIRMPTLFVLSGFLMSSRVRAGLKDRRAVTSAVTSYYIYVVWLAVFGLVALAGIYTGVSSWGSFVSQLLLPRTILWFVLGLALWTLVLGALHRVHPALVLVMLGILSIASFWMPGQNGVDQYTRILQYGFFFGLGVYGKPILVQLAAGKLWLATAGALAAYLGVRMIMSAGSGDAVIESTLPIVRDTAAVAVTIVLIAILCRARWVRTPLVWVGRRTLPIYVMHPLLIWSLAGFSGWESIIGIPGMAWVGPLLGTLAISLVAVGLYTVMTRTPLRVLFGLPTSVKRWLNSDTGRRRQEREPEPTIQN
jgi:peptidoglycan/LPS O-acetylase OafA/YrhL